ncbi:hypothetical protein HDU93_002999 [Gonapodya sp. JEL0774]|nr:hypothetical protein HDU93_002999 [Gonapodya sp. JEL0774]
MSSGFYSQKPAGTPSGSESASVSAVASIPDAAMRVEDLATGSVTDMEMGPTQSTGSANHMHTVFKGGPDRNAVRELMRNNEADEQYIRPITFESTFVSSSGIYMTAQVRNQAPAPTHVPMRRAPQHHFRRRGNIQCAWLYPGHGPAHQNLRDRQRLTDGPMTTGEEFLKLPYHFLTPPPASAPPALLHMQLARLLNHAHSIAADHDLLSHTLSMAIAERDRALAQRDDAVRERERAEALRDDLGRDMELLVDKGAELEAAFEVKDGEVIQAREQLLESGREILKWRERAETAEGELKRMEEVSREERREREEEARAWEEELEEVRGTVREVIGGMRREGSELQEERRRREEAEERENAAVSHAAHLAAELLAVRRSLGELGARYEHLEKVYMTIVQSGAAGYAYRYDDGDYGRREQDRFVDGYNANGQEVGGSEDEFGVAFTENPKPMKDRGPNRMSSDSVLYPGLPTFLPSLPGSSSATSPALSRPISFRKLQESRTVDTGLSARGSRGASGYTLLTTTTSSASPSRPRTSVGGSSSQSAFSSAAMDQRRTPSFPESLAGPTEETRYMPRDEGIGIIVASSTRWEPGSLIGETAAVAQGVRGISKMSTPITTSGTGVGALTVTERSLQPTASVSATTSAPSSVRPRPRSLADDFFRADPVIAPGLVLGAGSEGNNHAPDKWTTVEEYRMTVETLERKLREVGEEKTLLQTTLSRLPSRAPDARRRREELEQRLDDVEKELSGVKRRLKGMGAM